MHTVLYPGSFDPITSGHLDLIARAAACFDEVIVGVLYNAQKQAGTFPVAQRLALIEKATAHLKGVRAQAFTGLLVDAARDCGAQAVIRGLRTISDVDIELQMARLNLLMGGVETLMLASSPEVVHINATMVREIGRLGGNLHGFVPASVHDEIASHLCTIGAPKA